MHKLYVDLYFQWSGLWVEHCRRISLLAGGHMYWLQGVLSRILWIDRKVWLLAEHNTWMMVFSGLLGQHSRIGFQEVLHAMGAWVRLRTS